MKKLFFTLFFILFFFQGFSQNPENDSINKKDHKFLFGVTISPNYSYREYYNKNSSSANNFSFGGAKNDYPSMGYSLALKGKIAKRKFMFSIGAGVSFYNYKGFRRYDYDLEWRDVRYVYNHKLIGINTGYNILFGKNKLWNLGIAADINYIYSLTQKVKTKIYSQGNLIQVTEATYNFTNKQIVFMGGLEGGRAIPATKWLIVDISLSAKCSSIVFSKDMRSLQTQARNILIYSLNISFYPIFKRK